MANEQSQSNAHKGNHKLAKTYNFFQQALTIAIVLFISKIIESFIPFPMPASVIGLVLLFILLCTGVVKLGQVEGVGTALTNNISFLFVPAGISGYQFFTNIKPTSYFNIAINYYFNVITTYLCRICFTIIRNKNIIPI